MASTTAVKRGAARVDALIDFFSRKTSPAAIDRQVRHSIKEHSLSDILSVINQSRRSKLTFKSPGVLKYTIQGLRDIVVKDQSQPWSAARLEKAMRISRTIAYMFESEHYGFGKYATENDPRRQPLVIATYLELAAAYAFEHQEKIDKDGKVKALTSRLLATLETTPSAYKKESWKAPEAGRVDIVLDTVPILHSLRLAQAVLGTEMPSPDLAKEVIDTLQTGLIKTTTEIRARNPGEDTYASEALRVYDSCILRDTKSKKAKARS